MNRSAPGQAPITREPDFLVEASGPQQFVPASLGEAPGGKVAIVDDERRRAPDHGRGVPTQLPEGWTARRPTSDDHARVQAVLASWWGDLGGPAGAQQRALLVPRLFLQHFNDTSAIVEDGDGRLVAFLIGFLSQAQPDVAYVHFVGVDPKVQGSGLGGWLYRWFFAVAAARGAREVRCITSPENVVSHAFHTRMNFRTEPGDRDADGVPVQSDYDGPGLDRVSFVRSLP